MSWPLKTWTQVHVVALVHWSLLVQLSELTLTLTWWSLCFTSCIRLRPLYSRFSRQPWKFPLETTCFWESRLWTAPTLSCIWTEPTDTYRTYCWMQVLSPEAVVILNIQRLHRFHPTCLISQWLNSAGIWTLSVCLSTVRLRWELRRSTAKWCQCWSSNRLPREARRRGSEDGPGGDDDDDDDDEQRR